MAIALNITFSIFIYEAWAEFAADDVIFGNCVPRTFRFGDVGTVPYTAVSVKTPLGQTHPSAVVVDTAVFVPGDELVLVRDVLSEQGRYAASRQEAASEVGLVGSRVDDIESVGKLGLAQIALLERPGWFVDSAAYDDRSRLRTGKPRLPEGTVEAQLLGPHLRDEARLHPAEDLYVFALSAKRTCDEGMRHTLVRNDCPTECRELNGLCKGARILRINLGCLLYRQMEV